MTTTACCASALATERAPVVQVHDEFRWLYDSVSVTSPTSSSDANTDEMLLYGAMLGARRRPGAACVWQGARQRPGTACPLAFFYFSFDTAGAAPAELLSGSR
ncbi:hypothetical protein BS78_K088100 [Paspalum vaginatum]|uniref:Uncharacterized protein n=1 Tax=Paspalum vaginatum TaxID=158149 RepID=A0A9W8CFR0_9POAL|nr:hypothetical protein BS78_K088100 [Paspalum vaginatum]